jgi:F-box/TPR repeat protein Pof3
MSLGKHDKAVALAQKGVAHVKPNDPKSSTMQAVLEAALLAQHDHEQELKAKECHITKLPVELLTLIFEDVVLRHRRSPAALAHVCHLWRDLALNMSSLWYRLVLDDKGNKQEARTAFWLRHSRGRIRQLRVTTEKKFSECMSKLAGNASPHLEEIDFELVDLATVPADFRFQADPISFSWTVRRTYNSETRRLPFQPKEGFFRISELKIFGVDIDWQIEAQHLENLTNLVVETAKLQVFELLVILDHSPRIQTLEVQADDEYPVPERKERLVLASLSVLRLCVSSSLLRFIEVPALQTLRFEALHLGKALQDLSPPQPPLVHFSAVECSRSQDAILPLPDTLQTLRLTMLACNVDRVVDSLAAGKCLRLVELELSNTDIGSDSIIRLIKARNCLATGEDEDSSNPAKLKSLTMDHCDGISAESLPWIRSKVPRVSCIYESRASIRRRIY